MSEPTHSALLLAAGGSRRLGQPKQLLEIDGIPLIRRAALAALATGPQQLLVVLGAEVDGCRAALAGLALDIHSVEDWAAGMGASLACGVCALRQPLDGVLVVGVDQPALDAAHLVALVARWRADPARVVASGYADTVGTPALFPAAWLPRLAALGGDQGARALLRQAIDATQIIHAPALAIDIDDAQDFAAWQHFRSATGATR
jgi:CTP:molybdopterin cytidylyltransferase MocA